MKCKMTPQNPQTRVTSPRSFPHDPRHEQTRTPLHTICPRDRVPSQCSKRGESPLLRLPDEILAHVTRSLAGIDQGHHLPSFALAHSECRQLVRPFQFADVWIMDGDSSWRFLRFLLHDDVIDDEYRGLPSIGSCVRSLTFTFRRDFPRYTLHGGESETDEKAKGQWYQYYRDMLADLAKVIKHRMPMLERIHWQYVEEQLYYIDPPDDAGWIGLMPAILGKTTTSGRVRTLYLKDDNLCIRGRGRAKSLFPGDEPLRLTDLAIGYSRFEARGPWASPETDYFYETILRRSAQSLESLAFNPTRHREPLSDVWQDSDNITTFRDGGGGIVHFPKLRKFWCSPPQEQEMHPIVMESFLSGRIESFAPSPEFCKVMRREGMMERHTLPYLRTWAVTSTGNGSYGRWDPEHVDECLAAAQAYGGQIEDLFIYIMDFTVRRDERRSNQDGGPEATIPSHIASGKFSNLRSLCFVRSWGPDLRIFRVIGANLQTLEELSFGLWPAEEVAYTVDDGICAPGGRPDEPPSHSSLQSALAPLRNLQRLGMFADEYVTDFAGPRWAWHRYVKEHVWYHQGRSPTHREVGNMPFTGQSWSNGQRGHKTPGDSVQDWITPVLLNEDFGEDSEPVPASEMRQAACKLGDEYAAVLPKLQEFMIGRLLVEVTRL